MWLSRNFCPLEIESETERSKLEKKAVEWKEQGMGRRRKTEVQYAEAMMDGKISTPKLSRSFAEMKILCVSDLHARTAWYKWLVSESAHYDLVCLPGDLLNLGDYDASPMQQAAKVLPYLRAIKQRTGLAICSGNHDVLQQRGFETAQWMQPLRDEGIHVDGDVFLFMGYRFHCVPWCDPLPQHAEEDFWLMHAPPYGARTATVAGGVSHGCSEFRDVCLSGRGPLFALSGHVHEPLGFWSLLNHTISLNPGRGGHPLCPNHIVIDMKERIVTHHKAILSGIKPTTFYFMV